MPSEKRRRRRARAAADSFGHVRAKANTFGLELARHDDYQYSLEWHTTRARWELYPTTQRITINKDRKTHTPVMNFRGAEWTLDLVVDRAVELLGLEKITDVEHDDEMQGHTLGITHRNLELCHSDDLIASNNPEYRCQHRDAEGNRCHRIGRLERAVGQVGTYHEDAGCTYVLYLCDEHAKELG